MAKENKKKWIYMTGAVHPLMEDAKKEGYNGLFLAEQEMKKFCDAYNTARRGSKETGKKPSLVPVVREHEDNEKLGQIMCMYINSDDKLSAMFRIDANDERAARIKEKIQYGDRLGLSLKMTHWQNDNYEILHRGINHLGIVEFPDFAEEGTFVDYMSENPSDVCKLLTSEKVKYINETDKAIIQKHAEKSSQNANAPNQEKQAETTQDATMSNAEEAKSESSQNNNNDFLSSEVTSFNQNFFQTQASANNTQEAVHSKGEMNTQQPEVPKLDPIPVPAPAATQQQQQAPTQMDIDTPQQQQGQKRPREEDDEFRKKLEELERFKEQSARELEELRKLKTQYGNLTDVDHKLKQFEELKQREEQEKKNKVIGLLEQYNKATEGIISEDQRREMADLAAKKMEEKEYDFLDKMLTISTQAMAGKINSHKAEAEEYERRKRQRLIDQQYNEAKSYWGDISGGYTPASSQPSRSDRQNDNSESERAKLYARLGISMPGAPQQQQQQQQPQRPPQPEKKENEISSDLQEVTTLASGDPMAAIAYSIFKPYYKIGQEDRQFNQAVKSTLHLGKVVNNMVTSGSQENSCPFYRRFKAHEWEAGDINSSWGYVKEEDEQQYYALPIPTGKRY